jgi:hypothetical protein
VQANDGKRQQRSQNLEANGTKPRERLGERSR